MITVRMVRTSNASVVPIATVNIGRRNLVDRIREPFDLTLNAGRIRMVKGILYGVPKDNNGQLDLRFLTMQLETTDMDGESEATGPTYVFDLEFAAQLISGMAEGMGHCVTNGKNLAGKPEACEGQQP